MTKHEQITNTKVSILISKLDKVQCAQLDDSLHAALASGLWFSLEEALYYGLYDKVIDRMEGNFYYD